MNYQYFKTQLNVWLSFDDVLRADDIEEMCQEWYVLFKEAEHGDLRFWAGEHFGEMTADSSVVWLHKDFKYNVQ